MVIAGSMIAGADASPALPARTAAQLLADIARASAPPSSLSGVIVQTASLGLPQLPDTGSSGTSGLSLLTGSHTVKFWYTDPAHVRFAIPAQLGETDLRRDGRQVWLWDSSSQTATHIVLPARSGRGPDASGSGASRSGGPALTPQQAARQVLAAVGPTTRVSVQQNVMVAGQAAYQLAIAPRDSRSLIGEIRIAVDAHGYLPLRLQVFARGATSPAYQVGFTALSFARPAASNFTFTPPPGAKVKNVKIPSHSATGFGNALLGVPSAGANFNNRLALRNQPKSAISFLPAPRAGGVEHALRKAALRRGALRMVVGKVVLRPGIVRPGGLRLGPLRPGALGKVVVRPGGLGKIVVRPGGLRPGAGTAPTVIGKGWLSVIVVSAAGPSPAGAGMLSGSLFSHLPQHVTSSDVAAQTASSSAYSSTLTLSGPAGADLALLRALLRAATPVHGSWGSGRLLRTSLLSVLLTNSGHVLIGAVTPSVLYADAAKVK
jgi:outer membrane lipoprotein-sorting protein